MIVIHHMKTLPRLVGIALAERLQVMPAFVVTGARQTGKSTLRTCERFRPSTASVLALAWLTPDVLAVQRWKVL
jgi:hypothetical protein